MNLLLMPVHADGFVAGWLSLAVMGLIDSFYPKCVGTQLAEAHCWLDDLGLLHSMIGLAYAVTGHPDRLPLAVGSTAFPLPS